MNSLKRKCMKIIIDMCIFTPLAIFCINCFVMDWQEKRILHLCVGGVIVLICLKEIFFNVYDLVILIWEFFCKKDIRTKVIELNRNNYAIVHSDEKIIWKTETRIILMNQGEEKIVVGIGNLLSDIKCRKVVITYLWKSRLILNISPAE